MSSKFEFSSNHNYTDFSKQYKGKDDYYYNEDFFAAQPPAQYRGANTSYKSYMDIDDSLEISPTGKFYDSTVQYTKFTPSRPLPEALLFKIAETLIKPPAPAEESRPPTTHAIIQYDIPAPTYEATQGKRLDTELHTNFEQLLSGISFQDIATPSGDKPIAHADKFSFVPLVATHPESSSLSPAGFMNRAPHGIRLTYRKSSGDSPPYLDTSQAVGLVNGDHLIAVAAAGIQDGILMIKQLQDVTGVRKDTDKRAFYRTGLHNGFSWRQTLVGAWEELGKGLGAETVAVQSHVNSRWAPVRESGKAGYDDVAEFMGYVQNPVTKDWIKKL